MSASPNFSPVTQVLNATLASSPPEERVSEEQFNTLHASSVTYRDLLIFEERLKLNMIRLKKRQQKYEVFLGFLIVVIAYFAFATFHQPSQTYYLHMLQRFFLLLSVTTLFLFFATGMYSEKLGYSSKFVPQCNRVLRIFNMHFNRDNRPELSFFRKVPKKFQEGFSAYKASYFRRKSEKRAAALAAKAAGSSGVAASTAMGRTPNGQGRRLQPSSRGRRLAGGGGGGSASGSDSGPRPTMGIQSLTRGDGSRNRPLMSSSSSSTTPASLVAASGINRQSSGSTDIQASANK
ncbi:Spo7-like protein-domain-containing protein [Dissophora ornata]|nr:Spo7-like protein-domain-containing protein [Dissophora ornata]